MKKNSFRTFKVFKKINKEESMYLFTDADIYLGDYNENFLINKYKKKY